MASRVLIVESPAKKVKIAGFLGAGWQVLASLGHVRDLRPDELDVDIENGFKPSYHLIKERSNAVKAIQRAIEQADEVYLASDPDREGEAIAWHLSEACRKQLKGKRVFRITFNAITAEAVRAAVAQPRAIDLQLVRAQEARRIIDRLVGYLVSPLVSRLLDGRLTAGRVQSVCLRLVVERERDIQRFVATPYFTLDARFEGFLARYWTAAATPAENLSRLELDQALAALATAVFQVERASTTEKMRRPHPPFTTSALQQAASKAFAFAPERTMEIAQKLYENGWITYMRTDGVGVVAETVVEDRQLIAERYGQAYVPDQFLLYLTSVANAQEAHEGIRPTHAVQTTLPDTVDEDGRQLYELIWRRFVASQAVEARYQYTQARILVSGVPGEFRAQGRQLLHDGFLAIYEEPLDEGEMSETDQLLPPLQNGQVLTRLAWLAADHMTQAPGRYTEASLVQKLEREGIGRPSTFAGMVALLKQRHYAEIKQRRLQPTELGVGLWEFLDRAFPTVFTYSFTSDLETQLDRVAAGQLDGQRVIETFWKSFEPSLRALSGQIDERRAARQRAIQTGQFCPVCQKPLVRREGRQGPFIGCSDYPTCRYTRSDVA